MRETIEVKHGFEESGNVVLETEDSINESLKAGERVLADSDNLAFVYILENDDGFTYVTLSKGIWSLLKTAMSKEFPVRLTDGKTNLELTGLNEEIRDLTENIQGNSNYGEEMMNEVEKVFF